NTSEILELPVSERIQIVEILWESIRKNPHDLPVSDREKEELDKRLETFGANPDEGIEWKTLKENLTD
ncbi:MAG: addiction module protein, partial [Pyrinomonadaceae bacterium]